MTHKSFQRFLVYLPEEDCYGTVVSLGAFFSLVKYSSNGIEYEVFMENEELIFLDEVSIGIEEEDI